MWSPTGMGYWTDSISVIHGRSASTSSCSWFGTPSLCWWHSDLRFLPPRILSGTSEPYFCLYQRCSCVEIQSTATECWQDRDHLVYIITSPTSDTNCLVRYWRWCHHTCLISARPGNLSGLKTCQCERTFRRLCQLVLQSSVRSEVSFGLSLDQSSSRWLHHWCWRDWTMAARHWLVCLQGNWTDYSPS